MRAQQCIGRRLGTTPHIVDYIADEFARAYVVLGGTGFTVGKVNWFVAGTYRFSVAHSDRVDCVRTDDFLERAFRHKL